MVFEGTVNKDATVTVGGIAATVDGQNHFSAQVYVPRLRPSRENVIVRLAWRKASGQRRRAAPQPRPVGRLHDQRGVTCRSQYDR